MEKSKDVARKIVLSQDNLGKTKTSLNRLDLVEYLTSTFKRMIIEQKIEANSILPTEIEISKTFGVSRTVVREAMRNLRSQGLVEVSQGCAPRVKELDPKVAADSLLTMLKRSGCSLKDLLEFRLPIEGEIASLAALRAESDDISKLEKALNQLKNASEKKRCINAELKFHLCLAQATGNPVFLLMWDIIAQILKNWQSNAFKESNIKKTIEGHQQILNAIKHKDSKSAQKAMIEHLLALEEEFT